jgi:hypothetical protein
MKKVFVFRKNDSEKGRRVHIEVELTNENSFRACCAGPSIYWGQCLDRAQKELNIKNPVMAEIVRLWRLYHLSNMKAGLPIQEKAVKEYTKNNPYDYKKVCEYLESKNLLVVDGYKYGSAWLKEEIPADDLASIKALLEN